MMNIKEDLKSSKRETEYQFTQMQDKYIYYIGALSVTSIGFAVQQTLGQPIKHSFIPLALAIISWGISIYKGLKFIELKLNTLYNQRTYYQLFIENEARIEQISRIFENNTSKPLKSAKINFKQSFIFFILGCTLFIIWRIVDMTLIYFNSIE